MICLALTVFAVGVEFLSPLALISSRFRIAVVFAVLSMQVGIRALLRTHSEQDILIYAFWVPWGKWLTRRDSAVI